MEGQAPTTRGKLRFDAHVIRADGSIEHVATVTTEHEGDEADHLHRLFTGAREYDNMVGRETDAPETDAPPESD